MTDTGTCKRALVIMNFVYMIKEIDMDIMTKCHELCELWCQYLKLNCNDHKHTHKRTYGHRSVAIPLNESVRLKRQSDTQSMPNLSLELLYFSFVKLVLCV